jgi:hypothetical protein
MKRFDAKTQEALALRPAPPPAHEMRDSERLLRTHNVWAAEWDLSNQEEEEDSFDRAVQNAFKLYARGLSPIEVKWELKRELPYAPPRLLGRIQRAAERALLAAESAPADLRRAMVAAARQTVVQGALAAGEWGAANQALNRAGEIAGELRESAGLSPDDLVLTVQVEGDAAPLPEAPGEPFNAEPHSGEDAELELADADTESDQG